MKRFKRNIQGNIALTVILLVSSVLLFGGLEVLTSSMDLNTNSVSFYNQGLAQIKSKACIEESIYKIKNNNTYTGNFTLTFSDGNCTSTVTNSGTIETMNITSNVGSYNYICTKKVDTSTTPFSVSN